MKTALPYILFLFIAGAVIADPAGKPADECLKLPDKFLATRLVRSADTPARNYDVILDVPPAASSKDAKPRIAQSCGDDMIDGIAWDYAKSLVSRANTLAKMNRHKELRLRLRIVPLAVKRPHYNPPTLPAGVGYRTPAPPYPVGSSVRGESGSARLRVSFVHGRASVVTVEESTGNAVLDANAALFALAYWTTGNGAENATNTIPLTYRLSTGGHTGSYTGVF